MKRLNIVLAKTDHLGSKYVALLKEYSKFFKGSQGAFLGEKRTYIPKEGTVDEPSKRKNSIIQTTVAEKLDWLKAETKDYIDSLFSVEATNGSGTAKAELVVDGDSWGTFTSLELLRLKSLLESSDLRSMFENLPVRSDSINWTKTTAEQYEGREVFETELSTGVEKTTVKENYVLEDPNIAKLKDGQSYTPQVATKTTVQELGDYTHQYFSGSISQREKANILKRRSNLLTAVIEALKACNEVEISKSDLTSEKIFDYMLK